MRPLHSAAKAKLLSRRAVVSLRLRFAPLLSSSAWEGLFLPRPRPVAFPFSLAPCRAFWVHVCKEEGILVGPGHCTATAGQRTHLSLMIGDLLHKTTGRLLAQTRRIKLRKLLLHLRAIRREPFVEALRFPRSGVERERKKMNWRRGEAKANVAYSPLRLCRRGACLLCVGSFRHVERELRKRHPQHV